MEAPSAGPVVARRTVLAMGAPRGFRSGRAFAARLGLTLRNHTTADEQRRDREQVGQTGAGGLDDPARPSCRTGAVRIRIPGRLRRSGDSACCSRESR